uniref:ATP synthase F0 subunit 8 n=1 Tax=Peronospora matthiolae TaxID=2874970 RepID=A0AAV1T9X2_9STRA
MINTVLIFTLATYSLLLTVFLCTYQYKINPYLLAACTKLCTI